MVFWKDIHLRIEVWLEVKLLHEAVQQKTRLAQRHVDFTPLDASRSIDRAGVIQFPESESIDGSELVVVMPDVEHQIEHVRLLQGVEMVFGELQLLRDTFQLGFQLINLLLQLIVLDTQP